MIDVKLIANTDIDLLELSSHAALFCYQAETPELGKKIDVENRLFNVGHHTTLQHSFFTFAIEGIAVGDITFGFHLVHPFYNSDQRSGRYCAKMFLEPNFLEIEEYIKKFWPKVRLSERKNIIVYIKKGVGIYHNNIAKASEIARDFLMAERPYVQEKSLEMNAPKIAQEQMRMFIPVIFPTGFDYTINITVLAAMHRIAWTPPMRSIVDKMVEEVLKKFPEIAFIFKDDRKSKEDWSLEIPKISAVKVKNSPRHILLDVLGDKNFIKPNSEKMHPVDLLHFDPRLMNNSIGEIRSKVEISTATMGQDQRHRTIRRGIPAFTGSFYFPPILRKMKLENEAENLMREWIKISKTIPGTLAMILAPYGAMVTYEKAGSFNAVAHEQAKRLCWCAQEEIYHAGRELRMGIEKKKGGKSKLLQIFEPPCYREGKCAEGARYCGRDLKLRKTGDFFPKRKV